MAHPIFIVAGEASSDMHGAHLVRELNARRRGLRVYGVGGEAMRAEGFEAIVPAEETNVAGLTEVLVSLPKMWLIMRRLIKAIRKDPPEVAVLIDMPDFNLRLAKHLKKLGVPVVYYISPQVWAWRQGRVKKIRKLVTQMLVILPFERDFYQEHGVRVQFVGHPLVDSLAGTPDRESARTDLTLPPGKGPVLALLPGSRKKEITRHLPVMLESARLLKLRFPELIPVLPIASTVPTTLIDRFVDKAAVGVTVIRGQAASVLSAADAAIVCSGTSTLQAALLARPMVVIYRVSWLTFHILKRMVKVAHISLVNLIAKKRLVPELIQNECNPKAIADEMGKILDDPVTRMRLTQEFAQVKQSLGSGNTAAQVAGVVLNYIPDQHQPEVENTGALTTVRRVRQRRPTEMDV